MNGSATIILAERVDNAKKPWTWNELVAATFLSHISYILEALLVLHLGDKIGL